MEDYFGSYVLSVKESVCEFGHFCGGTAFVDVEAIEQVYSGVRVDEEFLGCICKEREQASGGIDLRGGADADKNFGSVDEFV